MPNWPQSAVGQHVQLRQERVAIRPGVAYDTMGVRWYGRGAYLRPPSRPQTKTLAVARAGDFVFCRIDSQNGPFAIVPPELDGALATNEFPLYAVKDSLDARFLRLCFSSRSTLSLIGKVRDGRDGRARWKEADFEGWPIPLPPVSVQRQIVEVMGVVDETLAALEKEANHAKIARAALLDRLIQTMGDDVDKLTLRDVAVWSSGGTPKADNPDYYGGEIPWAIIGDVRGRTVIHTTRRITQAGLDALGGEQKRVPAGAVLITMYGTIGRCAVAGVPMATNQAICRGVVNDRVSADYVRLWVSARGADLVLLGDGKTQQNISKAKVESFPIVVPSRPDQERIVSVVSKVDEQLESLDAELDRANSVRVSLLQSLLARQVEIQVPEPLDDV